MAALSSERMSPNRLPVIITSNCAGFKMSCMAALSTYMKLTSTSGYSRLRRSTVSRHRRLHSSTLALSTEQSLPRRFFAISKPMRARRSTSGTE